MPAELKLKELNQANLVDSLLLKNLPRLKKEGLQKAKKFYSAQLHIFFCSLEQTGFIFVPDFYFIFCTFKQDLNAHCTGQVTTNFQLIEKSFIESYRKGNAKFFTQKEFSLQS